MSGGSFNYLYHHLEDGWPTGAADASEMIEWLNERDMEDAAKELHDYFFRPRPSKEFRELVRAVEWFCSNDWSYDEVVAAYRAWKEVK